MTIYLLVSQSRQGATRDWLFSAYTSYQLRNLQDDIVIVTKELVGPVEPAWQHMIDDRAA